MALDLVAAVPASLSAGMHDPSVASALVLLKLVSSELSEMVSSIWASALLVIMYHGPNKRFFTSVRDLDDTGFQQAITFSLLDAAVELALFVLLVLLVLVIV